MDNNYPHQPPLIYGLFLLHHHHLLLLLLFLFLPLLLRLLPEFSLFF